MSIEKSVRGKEMVTLEQRIQADMLFYESLKDDEERIPSWDVRYAFGKVHESIKAIADMYHFVDDSRNEANVPTPSSMLKKTMEKVREIHYGDKVE
tara:strand:+ start:7483 stop:7770 length:288 start_codon:yes stop_codon:yes gene_type:complete